MPVLQINGTNDRYWTLDSMNLYWDDIKAPKSVVYLPNAGHGLDVNRDYAIHGIASLFRHVASGRTMPKLSWTHDDADGGTPRLAITSQPEPRAAQLWTAHSPTRDFRESEWTASPIPLDTPMVVSIEEPESGSVAFFGDLTYEIDGLEYHLSTQIRQVDPEPSE